LAIDKYANNDYQMVSDRDAAIVEDCLQLFGQLQVWRNLFAAQWEEVAELILPTSRNTFYYGNFNWPGQKKTDRQIDATGMMALSRFAAICDSLLTPRNMFWHGLCADDDYVMKDRATKLWFEQATKQLFKQRYAAHANFASQNQVCYTNLGAFGNTGMFIEEYWDPDNGSRGLRYNSVPLGELFYTQNHQGRVDGFIRWLRYDARQVKQRWPKTFPAVLNSPLEQKSQYPYDVLHWVGRRDDYDVSALDARSLPYFSRYISMQGRCILGEGGYRCLPIAISRYEQTPGESYGRSPAMMVLPALKTLNAEKRTFLKQGHRAADPVLLTADDGLVDFNLRPGAVNAGGMSPEGKPLVGILPTGQIQISEKMMAEEKSLIQDAFLVTLFQILQETPQMTATEVIERTNEKGILLAPTVGRQQSEYLGPMIERELDILMYLRMLPPMPPRLKEAKGEYHVVYTSPLSRAMRAQQAAGFMRTLETVKELVQITQDPSLLDPFDFDTAVPAIAEIQAVPPSWMADDDQIQQKRKVRAQAQQEQRQIQAAPAQAAMMKAQAAQAKAGMGQQQPQGQPPQQGQPQQPGLQQ
jgi:hypothetical protein